MKQQKFALPFNFFTVHVFSVFFLKMHENKKGERKRKKNEKNIK